MFIRGCRRCMLARSLVLQCRSAFLFASCEMLRDITRGTKVTRCRIIVVKCFLSFFFLFFFFSFFVLFVRVSILQSFVDDNVEHSKRWFWFLRLLLFLFFFFRIIAHLDCSRIIPCLLVFFYFNASCVFSRTMEFRIWRNEYCDNLSNIFSLIWRRSLKSCEKGLDKRLRL